MSIEWRHIPGYENLYEVSDDGQVRSIKGGRRSGRLLKKIPQSSGYLQVCLCIGKHRSKAYVHRIVLLAFVGPPPSGTEARHFPDRNVTNNRLENLSWADHLVNINDKITHDTTSSGERNGRAILTWEKVRAMREMKCSTSQREIAKTFGVNQNTVSDVLVGKTWREIAKLGADGKPVLREDGKVMKGPDYRAPDLAGLV